MSIFKMSSSGINPGSAGKYENSKSMEEKPAGLQVPKLHFISGCDASNNGYVSSLDPLLTGINEHRNLPSITTPFCNSSYSAWISEANTLAQMQFRNKSFSLFCKELFCTVET